MYEDNRLIDEQYNIFHTHHPECQKKNSDPSSCDCRYQKQSDVQPGYEMITPNHDQPNHNQECEEVCPTVPTKAGFDVSRTDYIQALIQGDAALNQIP